MNNKRRPPRDEVENIATNNRLVGYSFSAFGILAIVFSLIVPFFIDPNTPDSAAIGVDSLRVGGALMALVGIGLISVFAETP